MTGIATPAKVVDLLRQAKAFVFDFDGTLVDSNPIKSKGFERCFDDFPEQRDEILAYCRGSHHTPRSEKFRYVYKEILRLPYTAAVDAMLHERYASVTTLQIVQAPEIPAAGHFVRKASEARMTAVLSSTPHDVLAEIFRRRGWTALFRLIRGAPVTKGPWLRDFRKQHCFRGDETVFFGDTSEDYRASLDAGCKFVAVGKNDWEAGIPHVRDFACLASALD